MDPARPRVPHTRRLAAFQVREEAAGSAFHRSHPDHLANGEEQQLHRRPAGHLSYAANYSKGLNHNEYGEPRTDPYRALLRALHSRAPNDFAAIPLGPGGRRLTNPQAGLAFDLEGADAHALSIPPAPRLNSAQNSAEMGELYWMALLRDVDFADYGTGAGTDDDGGGSSRTAAAAASLSTPAAGGEFSDFRGPTVGDAVTASPAAGAPATLFRGDTPDDLIGPYLSQFLLKDIPYGTLLVKQLQRTVPSGTDFLTSFAENPITRDGWLDRQNGYEPTPRQGPVPSKIPATFRYIRNLRDLATYVHFDALFEAYLNACLILLDPELGVRLDPGNPYADLVRGQGRTQEGFGTFGGPHVLSLVAEVATRALKAVWFQKWHVHRRLRPEEFGGRIEIHRNGLPGTGGTGTNRYAGVIDGEILSSSVLPRVEAQFGSALLPQAFTEGCPTHPAYGSGHATVAGACVTVLKAWFDESFEIPNPQVPDPATGYTSLVSIAGAPPLTVGGELNKLAANIALGRNGAGVHWRTDYSEAVRLGEEVAIRILQEQKPTYNEDSYLSLTRFDGYAITI